MRINYIVLLSSACSIWSGCGGDDNAKKGSAAGNANSGKTAAAGNAVKKSLTGKAVVQNHGGPKPNNPPPPSPPAAPKAESNSEKIIKIREDCSKKFESMRTVKNVEPGKVYETQVRLSVEFHDCCFKMGQLTTDKESALVMSFGMLKLSHQLKENLSLLHGQSPAGTTFPAEYLDELIAGGEALYARLLGGAAGIKKEITLTQAEKDVLGRVFATFVVNTNVAAAGFPMGDSLKKIEALKVKLEEQLERNFEEKVRIKLLYKKIEMFLKYLTEADFLYLNQKSSVRTKIAELVRKS